jgi:hypothetical protein
MGGEKAMAVLAGLFALALGLVAILGFQLDYTVVLRSIVELGAVVAVFALICAGEARS